MRQSAPRRRRHAAADRPKRATKNRPRLTPKAAARQVARRFRERRDAPLKFYWWVGEAADALDATYGQATINTFADELQILFPGRPVNAPTVYRARQFRRLVGARKLKQLVNSNVTWSHITPLLSLMDHPKDQQQLLEGLLDGEALTSRDVRQVVRQITGRRRSRSRQRPPTGGWRQLQAELRQARETLARLDQQIDNASPASATTHHRVAEQLAELADEARRLRRRLRRAAE